MRSVLREPLAHFLLIGLALFLVLGPAGRPASPASTVIVITRADIDALSKDFARTWLRAPTAPELDGLIQDRVREEAACREAIALGLDRDDTVVRRRLRQKLEFVTQDNAPVPEPSETDLGDYLSAHPDEFRKAPGSTLPALSEVHDAVRTAWISAKRLDAAEAFYTKLQSKYSARIEK